MSEKRNIPEELREKMLGELPFTPGKTIPFTPENYLKTDDNGEYEFPEEFRAIFHLSPYNSQEKDQVISLIEKVQIKSEIKSASKKLREIYRKHIMDWENMFDLNAFEEVEYQEDEKGGLSKDLWDEGKYLPTKVVSAIADQLGIISGLFDNELLKRVKMSLK